MVFVVELSRVTRTFVDGQCRIDVLKDLDLKVRPGEFIVIVGPSGAGKSTILNIISGLDTSFGGIAKVFGRDMKKMSDNDRSVLRNQKLGFVFQSFHLLEHLSVLENVSVPDWLSLKGSLPEKLRSTALEALRKVGLEDRANANIGVLSGGERQRVAIARSMVNDPLLILADEPTGNLDRDTGISIVSCFEQLRSNRDRAVIVVSHDERVSQRADRVLCIEEGRLR